MPSHDTNVQYMTKVTYANLQDLVRIFTYSSAANRQDDFQDLHGSKIYVRKSKWKENLERKAPSWEADRTIGHHSDIQLYVRM